MKTLVPFAIAILFLSTCTNGNKSISQQLTAEFDASPSASVDLAKVGPPTWENVRSEYQLGCFGAGLTFARVEGILPAPEANHAVKVAIDEALKCKESGESNLIASG